MKKILLDTKWVGAVALGIFALIVAAFFTNISVKFVNTVAPEIEQKVDDFLPITISNGEITAPKDALISKVYGSGKNESKVVLDTRVDEMEASSIKDRGLYISRKYIYAVSAGRTEIRSIDQFPDIVLDHEVVHYGFQVVQERAGRYIFFSMFIIFWMFAAAAVGLYSLVMHWALSGIFHNRFAQTLRINTFAYIAISALTFIFSFRLHVIVMLILLFIVNYIVNTELKKQNEEK